MNFYEKLKHAAQLNRSLVCVGLDPDLKKLPACLAGKKNPIFEFNKAIIDATRDWVCCYKPQIAYYAGQGAEAELKMTIDYIREQAPLMPVILDAKRSDIGSTAEMYAREAFEQYNADAVTVNPYMGFDTLKPFLDYEDRGVVVLCRNSNPNSGDLQNLMCDGKMVYEHVAELARDKWNYNRNVALVVGAGNIWRGVMGRSGGMDRVNADYMGMLATVMNALCLRDFFTAAGVPAIVQSSIGMEPIAPRYDRVKAIRALEAGQLVIFAGGTGSPFFTTDTTAVLRALETDCDAVLKATKVDGVYTADPMKDPSARRFATLSFDEALSRQLKVMDSTAFSMCRDNDLPIIVFNFSDPESFEAVLAGDTSYGTIVS